MAKKKRKCKGLDVIAEEFAMTLIYEATSGKVGRARLPIKEGEEVNPISFRDRRALLDSVTKLLGAQKEPDDEEETGINSFKERLRGGESGTADDGTDTDAPTSET